jgi:hypothetical protein
MVSGSGVQVAGSGFAMGSGKAINAAVADATGVVLGRASGKVAADGTFAVVVPAMLTAGKAYTVAYYVDANANGFCNAPPADVSGTMALNATAATAHVDVMPSATPAPVCTYFGDFSFHFDSMNGLSEGHPGHNGFGVIADQMDNSLVTEVKYGKISATGELVLDWPTIFVKGHKYTFALFTDDNGSGVCGMQKKFIYQEACMPGADPRDCSGNGATSVPVTADVKENFTLHHEINQNTAALCTMYFPKATYP